MLRPKAEERKLREVKAVLQRLQGLSLEPRATPSQPADKGTSYWTRAPTRQAIIISLIVLLLPSALAMAYKFLVSDQAVPPISTLAPAMQPMPASKRTSAAPASTVAVAMRLMNAGRVQAAREQLLGVAAGDSADAAWALARSYDPNFLATIPAADARADVGEAERWYRVWYAIAVRQGLVADSVSLERIINSMR
jgi:hypothetical protein